MASVENVNISWQILGELGRVQSSDLKFGNIRGSSSVLFNNLKKKKFFKSRGLVRNYAKCFRKIFRFCFLDKFLFSRLPWAQTMSSTITFMRCSGLFWFFTRNFLLLLLLTPSCLDCRSPISHIYIAFHFLFCTRLRL